MSSLLSLTTIGALVTATSPVTAAIPVTTSTPASILTVFCLRCRSQKKRGGWCHQLFPFLVLLTKLCSVEILPPRSLLLYFDPCKTSLNSPSSTTLVSIASPDTGSTVPSVGDSSVDSCLFCSASSLVLASYSSFRIRDHENRYRTPGESNYFMLSTALRS